LALYVYEYLLHVGAQKSAQTFLSELRSGRVFWDLYCAAPERRDTCEHSSEAKAFHDYVMLLMPAMMIRVMNRHSKDEAAM
ncbi:hypothetical protein FQN60_017799, partial [Etheostoma spectabile]